MAEVDLWIVDELGPEARDSALARDALDPDEIARLSGFRDDAARDRFVVARTAVRTIVGVLTGQEPAAVELGVEPSGRPVVTTGGDLPPLHLSVAHTDGCVLVAVCRDHPVGVDVEPRGRRVRPALGERVSAPAERALLAGRDDAAWTELFLRFWVRKEAVVKADGRGLRVPLATVDVSGGGPVQLPDADGPIHVRDVEVGAAHLGAVALVGAEPKVRAHRWSPSASSARPDPPVTRP